MRDALSELLTRCERGGERRGRGPGGLAPGSEVLGIERKGGGEEENGGRELCWEESGGELGALELGKPREVREWPWAGPTGGADGSG